MEKDLHLPSLPRKATADFFSTIDLPQDWVLFLCSLNNTQVFSSSDMRGKLLTFALEYKCGQAQAASRQLSLDLCSGQYQRQALGIKGYLYGATIVDGVLTVFASKWEEDGIIVCGLPFVTFISY